MPENQAKKKPISPYTRMDRKYKEAIIRLVGILMQRKLLPQIDANYILEPLGEKAGIAYPGMAFFDEEGRRIE